MPSSDSAAFEPPSMAGRSEAEHREILRAVLARRAPGEPPEGSGPFGRFPAADREPRRAPSAQAARENPDRPAAVPRRARRPARGARIDASVGLKWLDSHLAEGLARSAADLLHPDFWLNEACNVVRLQVRRKLFTWDAPALLYQQVKPTPTTGLALQDLAPEIGVAINHSPYDSLYVAFAPLWCRETDRR